MSNDNNNIKTVIPFLRDFEITDLKITTYKLTTTTRVGNVTTTEQKKYSVPMITAGASKHQIIYCINEFYHAKSSLRWTIGTKLFENILDILGDPSD